MVRYKVTILSGKRKRTVSVSALNGSSAITFAKKKYPKAKEYEAEME